MSSESEAKLKSNDENPPLKTLGKYTIDRLLGQGGMGAVYLAHRTDLKKTVALKVLPKDKARNPTLVKRFKAEAQAAGQLEHPNIVAVYDTGEADGYLYIAMEYVDGIDLFEHLKKRRIIPVSRSIEIIKQIASALQHAYEQNIVHRDIKPSNLLLRRDGVIKITDLGLARSIDDSVETSITRAGTTVGTVDYMSPEQARNSKAADTRSDIYSLGCTWYQMLTGVPPFPEGSMTNKLHAHAVKPLPDPRSLSDTIPEGIYAILQRMTAKKPEDRYQTPAELLEDLKHAKLTRSAFSNEILADLTDDELGITDYQAVSQAAEDGDDEYEYDADAIDESGDSPNHDGSSRNGGRPKRRVDSRSKPESARGASGRTDGNKSDDMASEPRPRKGSANDARVGSDEIDSQRRAKKTTASQSADENIDRSPRSKNKQDASTTASKSGERAASSKFAPKPLPPKRQPLVLERENSSRFNLDLLKQAVVITAIASVIVGLGWTLFLWTGAMDAEPVQQVQRPPVPAAPAETPEPAKPSEPVAVTAAESPERPVVEFDIATQPLPAWAVNPPNDVRELPVWTVGPGAASETHFTNLSDAIAAAAQKAVHIQLQGSEPIILSNEAVITAKRIVMSPASTKDRSVIVMTSADSATGIQLNGGELDLRDLNFVVNRVSPRNGNPNAMVTVTDGQLFVRNCSFTAQGEDSAPVTALRFDSKQEANGPPPLDPILLVDQTVFRGNGLTGLSLSRTNADVVLRNVLSVTGSAPAIDLLGRLATGVPDTIPSRPRRIIRVLQSTLSCRNHLIDVSGNNSAKPPTTEFLLRDTICSAEGTGNTAILLDATRWPMTTSNAATTMLTNLNFKSISSLYLGFDQLVDLTRSPFKVKNADAWTRVWNSKTDANQFQPILWQEVALEQPASILPDLFDPTKLPYRDVKTATGALPGCDVSLLKVPEVLAQDRLIALSQHPKPPTANSTTAEPTQVIKVDLRNEDLGLILNRPNWPSGTEFHVTGTGIRQMTPVKILDKSLRIVFFQSEDKTPKLVAKAADRKQDLPALFTIENGSLEIESMTLDAAQSQKSGATGWLIDAKNANLNLKGCQLNGPMQVDLEQHQGLIRWTTSNLGGPTPDNQLPILSLKDCVLISTGVGLRADCAQGKIFVQNSVVAVRGFGLDVSLTGPAAAVPPTISLGHVSFANSRSAIRLERSLADNLPSPVRLYVENCAFLPPLDFKEHEARDAAVIECTGSLFSPKQVEWWGNSNGISKEIPAWLRRPDGTSIQTVADWSTAWGESSDVRLLTEPTGVLLRVPYPNKWRDLKLTSFLLDQYCPAATWATGGHPVGADIKSIEEALVAKKAPADSRAKSTKQTTPSRPGGKVDAGF